MAKKITDDDLELLGELGVDPHGLLYAPLEISSSVLREEPSDTELLEALGVDPGGDVTELVHVRSREEIKAAEEAGGIASPVLRKCAVGLGVEGSFRLAGGTQGVVSGSAGCH